MKRNKVLNAISELGYDVTDLQQLTEALLLAATWNYVRRAGIPEQLKDLGKNLLPWLSMEQLERLKEKEALQALSNLLLQPGMNTLPDLCRLCAPWTFADQAVYMAQFEPDKLGMQLAALTRLLKCQTEEPCLAGTYMEMTAEQSAVCRQAVWGTIELPHKPIRVPGTVSNVLKTYRNKSITDHKILEDFWDVKQNRDSLQQALNPWAYLQAVKSREIESGVTAEEAAFVEAFHDLRLAKPTDVIRAASYPATRNDSDFECGFLLPDFRRNNPDLRFALVVNPSPDMILDWELKPKEQVAFAVPDETIANLYRQEFSDTGKKFLPFSKIDLCKNLTAVLLTARDLPQETIRQLVSESLAVCRTGATAELLLPAVAFEGDHPIQTAFREADGYLSGMLLLPSALTASRPAKKALVLVDKLPGEEQGDIRTFRAQTAETENRRKGFCIEKDCRLISWQWLSDGSKTLTKLFYAARAASCEDMLENVVHRDGAKAFSFSNEIRLYYTVAHKGEYLAAKAYYRAGGSRSGAMLTGRIERGLRAKSEEELFQKLMQVPYLEEMSQTITEDFRKVKPAEGWKEYSLKTLWYLYRDRLSAKRDYREELALQLFDGICQSLSNLCPAQAGEQDYLDAMAQCAPDAGVQEWRQLQQLLAMLVADRVIPINTVDLILPQVSHRASAEAVEVRNSLAKRTLTHSEEASILQWARGETDIPDQDRSAAGYEVDWRKLYGAIRLLSGLARKEVCGLTWGDFTRIPYTDHWQLRIIHFVGEDGELTHEIQKTEKYRWLPVCTLLATMLQERKAYIVQCLHRTPGEREPIILEDEAKVTAHCKGAAAKKADREALEAAQIPPQLVFLPDEAGVWSENDLNQYQGDLFYTNYRARAKHLCGMTLGEIHYCIGLKAPNTFEAHYCDYSNPFMQYGMSCKLDRWASIFLEQKRSGLSQKKLLGKAVTQVCPPYRTFRTVAEFSLRKTDGEMAAVHAELKCEHGCHAELIFFEEEP